MLTAFYRKYRAIHGSGWRSGRVNHEPRIITVVQVHLYGDWHPVTLKNPVKVLPTAQELCPFKPSQFIARLFWMIGYDSGLREKLAMPIKYQR